jgi:hypothetical protein
MWLIMVGRFADDLYDFDNLCPLSSWALRMLRRFSTFVQEDDVKDADRKVGFDAENATHSLNARITCWHQSG